MIAGKKIIVGITASIAAYKTYTLIRLLVKKGAEVRVVITPAAKDFVSPVLLSTFSNHKVYCDFVEKEIWENHVHLGRWADLLVIAPATCNTIAKMANGICDNFLMATYLSASCKVLVLPAMDHEMWEHPSTKKNISTILSYHNEVLEPKLGLLASGIVGMGRLPEPEEIVNIIEEKYFRADVLKGKTILITAGPTEEPIDPVRIITNRSSGKTGYAIAETLYLLGANVVLVSGPVNISCNYAGIKIIPVNTAAEMFDACTNESNAFDIGIFCAAVADYTMDTPSSQKIKKEAADLHLDLVKTKDIIAHLGKHKLAHQKIIGFALETDHSLQNAILKLKNKHADLIVLNTLNAANTCFNATENKVSFIDSNERIMHFDIMPKSAIAENIAKYIVENWG